MKPIYIITRYDKDGKIKWERLSRNKNGYYAAIGDMGGFGSPGSVTLEEVNVSGASVIARYPNDN